MGQCLGRENKEILKIMTENIARKPTPKEEKQRIEQSSKTLADLREKKKMIPNLRVVIFYGDASKEDLLKIEELLIADILAVKPEEIPLVHAITHRELGVETDRITAIEEHILTDFYLGPDFHYPVPEEICSAIDEKLISLNSIRHLNGSFQIRM